MKKIKYIYGIIALGLSSCGMEAPFQGEKSDGMGMGELSKAALTLDVVNTNLIYTTKAAGDKDYDINQFYVVITKASNIADTVYQEYYGNMPDVVPLEAGEYKISAVYGEDVEAEFEKPYFVGESEDSFEIKEDEITTEVSNVKCELKNVKVTVRVSPMLMSLMSDDSYIDICMNNNNNTDDSDSKSLRYLKNDHIKDCRPGYFRNLGEKTLTAAFHGTIDGQKMEVPKILDDIENGNHYELTFKVSGEEDSSGDADTNLGIDANVTVSDINGGKVKTEDEPILDDNERPKEDLGSTDPNNPDNSGDEGDDDNTGDDNSGDDDNTGDDDNSGNTGDNNGEGGDTEGNGGQGGTTGGSEDGETTSGLVVELGEGSTVEFGKDKINEVKDDTQVKFHVESKTGLTVFTISVESTSDGQLDGMFIDLINPDDQVENYQGLQLLNNPRFGNEDAEDGDKEFLDSLDGEKIVDIDVSTFMEILMDEEGTHTFTVTVADAESSVTRILVLQVNKK